MPMPRLPLCRLSCAAAAALCCRAVHASSDASIPDGTLHVSTILSMALLLPLTITLFGVTLIAAAGARVEIRSDGRRSSSDKRFATGRGSSEDPAVGASPPPRMIISPTSGAANAPKPIASQLLLTLQRGDSSGAPTVPKPVVLIAAAPTAGGSTNVATVSPRPSPSKNALFPALQQPPRRSRLSSGGGGGGGFADPISRASSGHRHQHYSSPPSQHRQLHLPAPSVTDAAEATTDRMRASAVSAPDSHKPRDVDVSRSPSNHRGGGMLGAFLSPASPVSPGGSGGSGGGSRRLSSGARPSQTAASLYVSRVSVRAVNMRPYESRTAGGTRRGAGQGAISALTSAAAPRGVNPLDSDPEQEQAADADADADVEGEENDAAQAEPEPEIEEEDAAPDPSIAQVPARLMRRRLGVLLRLCFMATSFFAFVAGLAVSASVFLHVAPAASLSGSERIYPSSSNYDACVGFSKVAGLGYVLCKASAYLFFFVKQRLVQVRPHASSSSSSASLRASGPAGSRLSLMEKVSLAITLGVIPFAGTVAWQLTGESNKLDGTCEVWMPLVLNLVMISADMLLSLTYLWLFLKPLLKIMNINRTARARAAAMMMHAQGGAATMMIQGQGDGVGNKGGAGNDGEATDTAIAGFDGASSPSALPLTPIRDPLERIMRTNSITCIASVSSTILSMLFMIFAHIYESPILQKHIVTIGIADVTLTSCCIMLLMLQSASISAKPQQQQQTQQLQQTSLQAPQPQEEEPTAKRKLTFRERGLDAAAAAAVSSDAPPRADWMRRGAPAGRSIEASYSGSSGGGRKGALRSSRLDPVSSSSAASASAALHATPGHLARALARRSNRHSHTAAGAANSLLSGVQLTALQGTVGGGAPVRLRLYLPASAPASRPISRPGSRPVSRPPSQPPSPRLTPAHAQAQSGVAGDLSGSEGTMALLCSSDGAARSSGQRDESPNPLSPLAQHSTGSGGGTALSHTSGSSDESPPPLVDSPPPLLTSPSSHQQLHSRDGVVSLSPMHSTPQQQQYLLHPAKSLPVALPSSPVRSPFGGAPSGSFATAAHGGAPLASASPQRGAVGGTGTFAASLRVREVRDPPAVPSSSPPLSPALRGRALNVNSNFVASQQMMASSALLDLPSLIDQYRLLREGQAGSGGVTGAGGARSSPTMLGPPSPQRASGTRIAAARTSPSPSPSPSPTPSNAAAALAFPAPSLPAPLARHLSPDRPTTVTFAVAPVASLPATLAPSSSPPSVAFAAQSPTQLHSLTRQRSADSSAFVSSSASASGSASASASVALTSPSESRRSTATTSGVDNDTDSAAAAAAKRGGTLLAASSSTASSTTSASGGGSTSPPSMSRQVGSIRS